MKRLLSILSLLVFLGCNPDKQPAKSSYSSVPEKEIIRGNKILLQNQSFPDTFPKPSFKVKKAATAQIIPFRDKQPLLIDPLVLPLKSDPVVIRVGENNYADPMKLTVVPDTIRTRLPKIIQAKDPYMMAHNPFSFSFYSRSQGLPNDDISSIVTDNRGFLWISTYGAGLVRFDGKYFAHYTSQSGFSDNFLLHLTSDSQDRLIFGMRTGGLAIFDGEQYLVFDKTNGFPNNRVENIFEDSKGNLWIGTFGAGVLKYDGKEFVQYDSSCGLPGNVVYAITEDNAGNIWLGTRSTGLSRFNGKDFTNYSTLQGLSSDFVRFLEFDHDGKLWIGTEGGGISVLDGDSLIYYNKANGFPDNEISAMHMASDGQIWLGTRKNGLLQFDGHSFKQFTENDGLVNNNITTIHEDLTHKIWVGTYGGGVGYYNGHIFRHYAKEEGAPESFIRALVEDRNENKWLGMNSEGLLMLPKDADSLQWFTQDQGLEDNRIRSLYEDKNGNIWIGFLFEGVSVFDGDNFLSFEDDNLLSDISVVSVLEQNNGTIWIGSYGDGLFRLEEDIVIQYTTENGLTDNYIRKILEDEKGNLWIATRDGGVNYFDGRSFTHYTTDVGLPTNDIFDIFLDRMGVLWIGTNGFGLLMLDDDMLTIFKQEHGIGSDFVYSILQDQQGNMWFGTRWGISLFLGRSFLIVDKERNQQISNAHERGIFFKTFTRDNGFMGVGVNSKAMIQTTDDNIWIGANDLLTKFDPDNIVLDSRTPFIYLSWMGLFNEQIPWAELVQNQDSAFVLPSGVEIDNYSFDRVNRWFGIPENLTLAHDNNYVVFSFAGVSSGITGLLRYQHMLEGMEGNWSPLSENTEAHYGNLQPGKYNFRLRAMNKEGYFSDELQFGFEIAPPWWLTWWAYLLYALIFLGLAGASYLYLKKLKIIRERKKLEEMELQQKVQIAQKSVEFKQNFLANMSHEIRTPLTGVLGMADLLLKTPLNEKQLDYLRTLVLSGENLREIINLVLDYSKIEAGKVKLHEEIFSIEKLLADAEKLFFSICRKDIVFIKDTAPQETGYLKGDYSRIFQIISNLLSNAVKFTEKGSISIKIKNEVDSSLPDEVKKIRVLISDTGRGVPSDEVENLFKPFYQTDQSYNRNSDGTGLGLAICKELSEILGGSIGYERNKNKGSTFWFSFVAHKETEPVAIATEISHTEDTTNGSLDILLVEDKAINQKVITLMLESMNHRVSLAVNGQKAIQICEKRNFDLILMDIQMPVMDGITATQIMKTRFTNLPPIVGLSANAFEGDREKYMKMGMDEYLTKPVKESDFSNMIKKLNLKS